MVATLHRFVEKIHFLLSAHGKTPSFHKHVFTAVRKFCANVGAGGSTRKANLGQLFHAKNTVGPPENEKLAGALIRVTRLINLIK